MNNSSTQLVAARAAAHTAARLQNIENNVEGEFNDRQGMSISDVHHESTEAHQAQRVMGIFPAPDIHEHFTIDKGYGKLRTSSRTTSTTLSTLRLIART